MLLWKEMKNGIMKKTISRIMVLIVMLFGMTSLLFACNNDKKPQIDVYRKNVIVNVVSSIMNKENSQWTMSMSDDEIKLLKNPELFLVAQNMNGFFVELLYDSEIKTDKLAMTASALQDKTLNLFEFVNGEILATTLARDFKKLAKLSNFNEDDLSALVVSFVEKTFADLPSNLQKGVQKLQNMKNSLKVSDYANDLAFSNAKLAFENQIWQLQSISSRIEAQAKSGMESFSKVANSEIKAGSIFKMIANVQETFSTISENDYANLDENGKTEFIKNFVVVLNGVKMSYRDFASMLTSSDIDNLNNAFTSFLNLANCYFVKPKLFEMISNEMKYAIGFTVFNKYGSQFVEKALSGVDENFVKMIFEVESTTASGEKNYDASNKAVVVSKILNSMVLETDCQNLKNIVDKVKTDLPKQSATVRYYTNWLAQILNYGIWEANAENGSYDDAQNAIISAEMIFDMNLSDFYNNGLYYVARKNNMSFETAVNVQDNLKNQLESMKSAYFAVCGENAPSTTHAEFSEQWFEFYFDLFESTKSKASNKSSEIVLGFFEKGIQNFYDTVDGKSNFQMMKELSNFKSLVFQNDGNLVLLKKYDELLKFSGLFDRLKMIME